MVLIIHNPIKELVRRLKAFAPSHVAVEVAPERTSGLNDHYQQYLAGDYTLSRTEIDQVAFRLAQVLGHREVYRIDHQQEMGSADFLAYIEAHGLADLKAEIDRVLVDINAMHQRIEAEGTIIDLFLVGARDTWVGANWAANWYARNLKMYANILGLAQRPEDRVFVLVGAGHAPLLREFLRQTPQVELIHPDKYLYRKPGIMSAHRPIEAASPNSLAKMLTTHC